MANIELNIVALGDFTSVNDAIKKLQLQVAALNNSLSGATGASFDKATASVRSLSTEFGNALTASGAFSTQTVQLQTETEKFGVALQKGTLSAGNYYQILTRQQGAATDSVKALALEQTKLQNSIVMSDPSKKGLYSVLTPNSINQISNATKIATNEQNLYNIALDASSNKLINWGKNTQWAGRQLTVGLAMPLLLFGQQALSSFNSVNNALTQFAKVYGEGLTSPNQTTINQMSDQVLKLGKNMAATMGISLEFTTQVATQFAAMGKMGGDLTTAVEQTDRLAKLGNLDQTTATNAVIALQNVYKLNTTQLADAVNYFGAVQKQTSLSMNDLVQAESRVGPVIDQLGGSYKDTAVMVLAMKEAGVPAAKSANALKSAMASIIAPTSAATKEFASFGINLGAIKNAGGPVQMVLALQKSLEGLQPLARQQLIEKLFGKFQFGNITALIENLGKAGSQTANAMAVAAASSDQLKNLADQEIKQATSSPSAQWAKALATFKADLYPIGQDIMKVATKLLDFGNKVSAIFQGLPGPVKFFLGLLAGLTVLAGPIIMLTGLMANFVGNILKGVIFFKDLISGGQSIRQLLTPQLIAAQNASSLFADGIKGDVDEINLLTQAITDLTEKLSIMKEQMGVGAGIDELKSAVGATAQVETSIFSQMALPGFAEGGIIRGPGTGKSDSILARVSNGETILTEEQTRKNAGVIADIISGKHIPGYSEGKNVLGHTKGNFQKGDKVYDEFMSKNPNLAEYSKLPGARVDVLSNLAARMPQQLNTQFRSGSATADSIRSGMSETPYSFAESAMRGGISSEAIKTEGIKKALQDFQNHVTEEAAKLAEVSGTIGDKELSNVTKQAIKKFKSMGGAAGQVATSLEKAGTQYGGYRTFMDKEHTDAAVEAGTIKKVKSEKSKYEDYGSLKYNGQSVGEYGGPRGPEGIGDLKRNKYANVPEEIKSAVTEIRGSVEKTVADGLNIASESNSPSVAIKEATTNMVDGAVEGLKAGKAPVKEAVQDELMLSSDQTPDLTPQVGPRMTNGGFYSGEIAPGIMGDAESLASDEGRFSGLLGKVKGLTTNENGNLNMQTKMAGSAAMMMGGQALSGMLPKGSNVSNIAGSMSNMAGMGMMFGPWGAAAGAALGLVTGGIGALMKAEKEHQATAQATFTASSDAIQLVGGSVANTTHSMMQFNDVLDSVASKSSSGLAKGLTVSNDQINSFAKSVSNLPKDNPLALVMQQIQSTSDDGAATKIAQEFAATQMAINGISQSQANSLIQLMLSATGHNATGATGNTPASQLQAIKTTLQNLKPDTKEFQTFVGTLTDLAVNTTSWDTYKSVIDAIGSSAQTSDQYLTGLISHLNSIGDTKSAGMIENFKAAGFTAAEIVMMQAAASAGIQLNTTGSGAGLPFAPNNAADDKVIQAALQAAKDKLAKDTNAASVASSGSSIATTSQASSSALLKDQIKTLTAKKKIIDAELKTQKDISSEMQRQMQYQNDQTSAAIDAKNALEQGDYIKAAESKQQAAYNTMSFNAQTNANTLQDKSDQLETEIENLSAQEDELNQSIQANTAATLAATAAKVAADQAVPYAPPVVKFGQLQTPNNIPSLTSAYNAAKAAKLGGTSWMDGGESNFDPSNWNNTSGWLNPLGGNSRGGITKLIDSQYTLPTGKEKNYITFDHNNMQYLFSQAANGVVNLLGSGKMTDIWDKHIGKFVAKAAVNLSAPAASPSTSLGGSVANGGVQVNIQVQGNADSATVAALKTTGASLGGTVKTAVNTTSKMKVGSGNATKKK